MPTIKKSKLAKFRQMLHGSHKKAMSSEAVPLSKDEYTKAFQAVEDFWEANRLTLKAAIDNSLGRSVGGGLAKKMVMVWMKDKWRSE